MSYLTFFDSSEPLNLFKDEIATLFSGSIFKTSS